MTSGTEWYLSHRDEFEAQRKASVDLRARLETEAAAQREHRRAVALTEEFAEEAEQLTRIDGELREGKPVENMAADDLRFLLGPKESKDLWDSVGGSRRQRWRKAVESLPDPPADASEHVRTTFATHRGRAHDRKKDGLRNRVPKQAARWYRELARREVCRTVANHLAACAAGCAYDDWAFLLDAPTYLRPGEVFDPAGNFKPSKSQPELDDSDGT